MTKIFAAIIEDDDDDRDFISSSMKEKHKDLRFITFSTGMEFFEFMKSTATLPNLIVTDLRMPVISGFDVLDTIKKNDKTKNIIVIVLSTSGNEQDIEKAKSLGAAEYYVKPYTLKEYGEITNKIVQTFNNGLLSFSDRLKHSLKMFLGLVPGNNIIHSQKPAEVL